MANPTEEDASTGVPVLLPDDTPVVNVTVSGLNEVMKKAMEDAQAAMKEAQDSRRKAVRVP